MLIREKESPWFGQSESTKAFVFNVRNPLDSPHKYLRKEVPALLSQGLLECHTPWACKNAGTCGHGLYHWFGHGLKQGRAWKQPSLPGTCFHITLCTYVRNKPSKTHKPNSGKRSIPPQINQKPKKNAKQDFLFFCIFKSRNKEKNSFLGLKINKHNMLG